MIINYNCSNIDYNLLNPVFEIDFWVCRIEPMLISHKTYYVVKREHFWLFHFEYIDVFRVKHYYTRSHKTEMDYKNENFEQQSTQRTGMHLYQLLENSVEQPYLF